MNQELDKYEKEIEDNISSYEAVTVSKKALIEGIIDRTNKKKYKFEIKSDIILPKHR